MGKHTDKLGSFENFTAPWETEAGSDAEIDKPKLKRLIFNLKSGEAKALDAQADNVALLEAAETALEKAQADLASASGPEAAKQIEKLQAKVTELQGVVDQNAKDKEVADLRAEVIGDLDPKFHQYITGETQEEIEKSLDKFKETFGITDEPGDEDNEDDEKPFRITPQSRLQNPADPKNGKPADKGYDPYEVAAGILSAGPFG